MNAIAFAATALLAACGGGDATAPLTSQTISFTPATTGTVGTPITLEATASSKLAVRFTASPETVCTVKDTTLTLVGAGTCNVKADQAGNTTFAAATQVSKDITVSNTATPMAQAALVVVPGASTLAPSATTGLSTTGGNGTGAVTYSITSGSCSISGTTLTAAASTGTCKISATKAADGSYSAATSSEVTVTVSTCITTATQQCYSFAEASMAISPFGADMASTVANDPKDSTNKVAKYDFKANTDGWAGGTVNPTGAATGNTANTVVTANFSTTKTATLRSYSPELGKAILLKFENADGSKTMEVKTNTTKRNEWETLTFDFAQATPAFDPAAIYNKVSIFPDFTINAPKSGGAATYYFDELKYPIGSSSGGTSGSTCTPSTSSNASTLVSFDTDCAAVTGFEGAEDSTVAADPVTSTNKVAKVVKSSSAQPWAGTTAYINTANKSIARIPFTSTATIMKLKVYVPAAGIVVRLKVEDASNDTKSVETEATTTQGNTWETLTFNFANQATGTAALNTSTTYNKASVFFKFGTSGANGGGGTFYFDDLTFGN
eukprot:gene13059-15058_t